MGHILEFLLECSNFIKLATVVMEHLDRSSLQPTWSHRQDLVIQIGEKWAQGAHHQWNYNMGPHRSQRERFVSCLSSLGSNWGAPVGWTHTPNFGSLVLLPLLWRRDGDCFSSSLPHFAVEGLSGLGIQGRVKLCWCICGMEGRSRREEPTIPVVLIMDRPRLFCCPTSLHSALHPGETNVCLAGHWHS